ncbi:patatin-like phospholipase family protein [Roseitranquillus sediminis]|uniref:patatin-like phospholipase family protein n=1 Tax=Roseitranquillus sediminis TaxID=2809051 RepID=UPI001D0BFE6E|nr:patatin-like phospholipase family protein [Roseitranquillus sediminis]MBM9595596.1 patatin-like phospholipase family protein [Roseitranquillus sediminis]
MQRINLALQGGGAHGAYTWGVLDRLLREPDIEIAAISGTSAGALNGAALKAGMIHGGREGARENLARLWGQVTALNDLRLTSWMTYLNPAPSLISQAIEYSLPFSMMDAATRVLSPYSYGIFYQNPLRRIAERFRYDEVCASDGPRLFISATNVRTGKIRVFTGTEISTDVILASACLPTIFQAVEIDDPRTGHCEAFWDGGYTGNPALFPLFERDLPDDIVIVNINPLKRDSIPRTPQEIVNRINEISFNSSLLRELRAINFVKELIADGRIPREAMKDVLIHMISDDDLMNDLSVATKLVPSPYVIGRLRAAGEAAAEGFLKTGATRIGVETTVSLSEMFS